MPKNLLGKKEVSITQSAGKTYLETYAQKAEIDLDKKTLVGYSNKTAQEYVFASINETLTASNLTNYIKKLCKDKEADKFATPDEGPFKVGTSGDIVFIEPSIFSTNTSIVDASRLFGNTLKDVSPTLDKDADTKQAYCRYLNTNQFWKDKVKS